MMHALYWRLSWRALCRSPRVLQCSARAVIWVPGGGHLVVPGVMWGCKPPMHLREVVGACNKLVAN